MPRLVRMLTVYLSSRWDGISEKELERTIHLIATGVLAQGTYALVNNSASVVELIYRKVLERQEMLNGLPRINALKDKTFVREYDGETKLLWTMASHSAPHQVTALKRNWNESKLQDCLIKVLKGNTQGIKGLAPNGFDAITPEDGANLSSRLNIYDELREIKELVLNFAARGLTTEPVKEFIRRVHVSTVYIGSQVHKRAPYEGLIIAVFKLMLSVKAKLDLRDLEEELNTRTRITYPELIFDVDASFRSPVLNTLAPKDLTVPDLETMERRLLRQLTAEYDAARAQEHAASGDMSSTFALLDQLVPAHLEMPIEDNPSTWAYMQDTRL